MSKSIIQKDNEKCFVCGDSGHLEDHHIFQGPNRSASEHYGIKVYLCPLCHRLSKEAVHNSNYLKRELHAVGQLAFEKKYSKDKFIQAFGRDYIEAGLSEGYIWREYGRLRGKYGIIPYSLLK